MQHLDAQAGFEFGFFPRGAAFTHQPVGDFIGMAFGDLGGLAKYRSALVIGQLKPFGLDEVSSLGAARDLIGVGVGQGAEGRAGGRFQYRCRWRLSGLPLAGEQMLVPECGGEQRLQ
ncbi:hypothetical protein D3C76_1093590 [compost metagenome]